MSNITEFIHIVLSNVPRGIIPGSMVIVYSGNSKNRKYLLTKATHSKNITFPSGSISWWENFEMTAKRELYEETGINISKLFELPIRHKFTYKNIPLKPKSIQHIFSSKLNNNNKEELHSKETELFIWATEDEVIKLLTHQELISTFKDSLRYIIN